MITAECLSLEFTVEWKGVRHLPLTETSGRKGPRKDIVEEITTTKKKLNAGQWLCTPLVLALESQGNLCLFRVSLVYTGSSLTAKATQGNMPGGNLRNRQDSTHSGFCEIFPIKRKHSRMIYLQRSA